MDDRPQPDPQTVIPAPVVVHTDPRCQWCGCMAITDHEVSPGVNAWVCGRHLEMILRNEETAALRRRHDSQVRGLTHPDPAKKAKAVAQVAAIETRLAELGERVESLLPKAPTGPKASAQGPTQHERVHKALKLAGRRGITRLDFENNPVIDGGPKILRTARCICDLKDQGVNIVADRSGLGGCARYWLAENAPGVQQAESRAA